MNRYKIQEIIRDRYAVWYMSFSKKKGKRIGCYKVVDLYSGTRTTRFAFRYLPREGQTQEQSDNMILTNCIFNFYRKKIFMGNRTLTSGDSSLKTA